MSQRMGEIKAEREADAKRLRNQAARLRAAARQLDLAATYLQDGAYETCTVKINAAGQLVTRTVRYMDAGRWKVRTPPPAQEVAPGAELEQAADRADAEYTPIKGGLFDAEA